MREFHEIVPTYEYIYFIIVTDLSLMLKNAVETIRPPGVEIFMSPVDTVMNPNYIDYIFHPMDLGTISQKVSLSRNSISYNWNS